MNYYNYPFNPPFGNNTQQFNNGANLFFVGSEEEAKSWIVSPSQTVYLLDRNNGFLYVKTVERNGMAQPLTTFKLAEPVSEVETVEYATKQDIENLNKIIKEIKDERNEHSSVSSTSAE